MACNCIHEIEAKIVENQPVENKMVVKATIKSGFAFKKNGITRIALIPCSLEILGQKKEKILDIAYSFCPFCGKPLDDNGKEVTND